MDRLKHARERTVGVHIAPIGLTLRMLEGVPVDLACRCLETARSCAPCQFEHIRCSEYARHERADGIRLIEGWACGACEVIYVVKFLFAEFKYVVVSYVFPDVVII